MRVSTVAFSTPQASRKLAQTDSHVVKTGRSVCLRRSARHSPDDRHKRCARRAEHSTARESERESRCEGYAAEHARWWGGVQAVASSTASQELREASMK